MSASYIFGNFTVVDGELAPGNSGNSRGGHVLYTTSIYAEDNDPIPASIRTYSLTNSIIDDDTVVFLYGKISGPIRGSFNIESISIFVYPGDPTDETHGTVPAFTPRLCVLGHIAGPVETTYEGGHIFKVNSTAFVRDSLQSTSFMGYFSNKPRRKNISKPNANSAIHLLGPINRIHDETLLAVINIEDVTLNAGTRQGTLSSPDAPAGPAASRRYPIARWSEGKRNIHQSVPVATFENEKQTVIAVPDVLPAPIAVRKSATAYPKVGGDVNVQIRSSQEPQETSNVLPPYQQHVAFSESVEIIPAVEPRSKSESSRRNKALRVNRAPMRSIDEGSVSADNSVPNNIDPQTEYVTISGRPATPHPFPSQHTISLESIIASSKRQDVSREDSAPPVYEATPATMPSDDLYTNNGDTTRKRAVKDRSRSILTSLIMGPSGGNLTSSRLWL